MTAKEYLQQIEKLSVLVDQKIAERDDLYKIATRTTANYEGIRVQSSGDCDNFARISDKLAKVEKEIDRAVDRLVDEKNRIIKEIQQLKSPAHISMLYKRYVELKRFEQIAVEMHYSYQYVRVLHGRSLEEFKRCYTNLQARPFQVLCKL